MRKIVLLLAVFVMLLCVVSTSSPVLEEEVVPMSEQPLEEENQTERAVLEPTPEPTPNPEPTEMEILLQFLKNDTTDKHSYVSTYPNCYICGHFAESLCENASEVGLQLFPVRLYAKSGRDHTIAVTKINDSWVFIEPMSDSVFAGKNVSIIGTVYSGYKIGRSVKHFTCGRGGDVVDIIEISQFVTN